MRIELQKIKNLASEVTSIYNNDTSPKSISFVLNNDTNLKTKKQDVEEAISNESDES